MFVFILFILPLSTIFRLSVFAKQGALVYLCVNSIYLTSFYKQGALVVMYVCVNSIYFTSFYKQGVLVVMYVCVNSIYFTSFYKQGALVVMYVCVNSIYFTSFYDLSSKFLCQTRGVRGHVCLC